MIAENRLRLLNVCRVYAWGHADQEDLYQDMLFQIWRALPNLRDKKYAATWLYRIALNTAVSFVRKDKARRRRIACDIDPAEHEISEFHPASDADQRERLTQLHEAIAQLKVTDKAVVTLFLEGLSYAEIADVLGVTENNAGVILHRAKKKLATLMKEAPCTTTN